ncbi:MAG: DUF4388 domain-containing protein [Candidatus Sericytochromatia bacterium]
MIPSAVLIDSNSYFRQALSSRLELLGIEPVLCESLTEAWPLLGPLEQGLLILPLADHSIEALRALRRQGKELPCLLLSDMPDPELQEALAPHCARLCRPHPGQIADLIRRLDAQHYQLRFQFDAIGLFDLVQLLAKARASLLLFLASAATEACLCFEQGRILHASCGSQIGEEAFFRIMSLTQGHFLAASFGQLAFFSIDDEIPRLIARSALLAAADADPLSQRFSGRLSQLNLYDLLEILGMGTRIYRLSCSDAFSGEIGEIRLGQGLIRHAEFGSLTGFQALASCLRLKVGQICARELSEAPASDDLVDNIGLPVAQVLLSLALEQDQAAGSFVDEGLSLLRDWPGPR